MTGNQKNITDKLQTFLHKFNLNSFRKHLLSISELLFGLLSPLVNFLFMLFKYLSKGWGIFNVAFTCLIKNKTVRSRDNLMKLPRGFLSE